jgi:uncharacterized RDD family membrane protein YckC
LSGVVIAAPPGYSGANALAPAIMMTDDTAEFLPPATAATAQPNLFTKVAAPLTNAIPGQNVIPFDRRERVAARPPQVSQVAPPQGSQQTTQRVIVRKSAPASTSAAQGSLDFVPAAPGKGRKLKTDVEARVFCGQPVATPTHRVVACMIDGAIVLFGYGLLLGLFELLGGSLGHGNSLWIAMGAVLALVAMLYGLMWAIAGRETAGMHLTDLQLITFDGFPLDPRSRVLRFASTWLSFCSGGLGLLWALADEENLTWHDHISNTFPTIREVPGTFVKQRL